MNLRSLEGAGLLREACWPIILKDWSLKMSKVSTGFLIIIIIPCYYKELVNVLILQRIVWIPH